jgi:hypothetical protein
MSDGITEARRGTYFDKSNQIKEMEINKQPNPTPDKKFLFNTPAKIVRILGYGMLWWNLDIGITLLILSEVIGD